MRPVSSPRSFLIAATSLAAVVCALPAAAANDHGFELMLRPAYGSAGASSPIAFEPGSDVVVAPNAGSQFGKIYTRDASPYGGGFIGEAFVGFRVMKYFSFGFTGGMRKSSASAVDDGTDNLARSSFSVGPYLRAYLPVIPGVDLDPWISVGVSYMHDQQTYTHPLTAQSGGRPVTIQADYTLEHHGVAVPIAIGVDYAVLPMLAIGPSFEYTTVAGAGGCAKFGAGGVNGASLCTDGNPQLTKSKGYGVWSIGLDLRLTVF